MRRKKNRNLDTILKQVLDNGILHFMAHGISNVANMTLKFRSSFVVMINSNKSILIIRITLFVYNSCVSLLLESNLTLYFLRGFPLCCHALLSSARKSSMDLTQERSTTNTAICDRRQLTCTNFIGGHRTNGQCKQLCHPQSSYSSGQYG